MTWVRLFASACFLLAAARGGAGAPPKDNPVLEWNEAFIVAVRKSVLAPDLVARDLAILHLAMADCVAGTADESALVQAAFTAATALMPGQRGAFEALRDAECKRLGEAGRGAGAIARGTAAAERVLREQQDDGCNVLVTYVPSLKPGQWRRTPPFFRPPELPQFASKVRPMVLRTPDELRPAGPPLMDSAAWAEAFNEIKQLGRKDSSIRTAEQTTIARFWADFSSTETPPGHWNSIARGIATARGLSVTESARLFATMNVALFDTAIACWDAKYAFNLWRPATAIARAAEDENPDTAADPSWTSLLPTPAHPEYVSGHSAFSGAAATVLTAFLGGDAIEFTAQSDTLPGVERHFTSLQACVLECGESRVYGGIHYRFSCVDGKKLGEAVARAVLANRMVMRDAAGR